MCSVPSLFFGVVQELRTTECGYKLSYSELGHTGMAQGSTGGGVAGRRTKKKNPTSIPLGRAVKFSHQDADPVRNFRNHLTGPFYFPDGKTEA